MKNTTDAYPSLAINTALAFGLGNNPPDSSIYYGTNSLGAGGLVLNTPAVNIANNNTHILHVASNITISANASVGNDATNIMLAENSTIHCSNITSSGGINAVNCVATNG